MVPVKIECDCGQHYTFDVEPVNGRMPAGVACPTCGADGTAAANEYLSQQLAPAATAAPAPSPQPMRTILAAPTGDTRRGRMDLSKAEQEARAKIMWGESMEQVAAYLTIQGISRDEAVALAEKVFQERTSIVRGNGIKKIIIGIVLMCVPLIAYAIFEPEGRFPIRFSIWCYGVGILGAYLFFTGILAVVAPKSEKGAVAKE